MHDRAADAKRNNDAIRDREIVATILKRKDMEAERDMLKARLKALNALLKR